MIRRLRDVALALGDGIKAPAPGEAETARLVRRSWHVVRDVPAGGRLAPADVALLRPEGGMAPAREVVGHVLVRAKTAGSALLSTDLAS
jgi:sialic acid synthase SpsE